ncbi:MAG: hypothetical protein DDT19_01642 [Syntrophomonadaceae bacterium]|nr:hypothetical protein [Bacillota bacterium]
MKILLSFVGKQDPVSENTNEEGSIVTLCRQLQPDTVYLYPTASSATTLSETQTHAAQASPLDCDGDFALHRSLQIDNGVSDTVGSLLKELRETRNDSIAAHGMKPVDKQAASNALKVMRELFAGFFPIHILEQYSFQYNTLKISVEYLTKNFSA